MVYMLVGCGGIKSANKKYSIFKYLLNNLILEHAGDYLTNVNVGQQFLDQKHGIVYVTDETIHLKNQTGGGGYVIALSIDQDTGTLSLKNEKASLGTLPSYLFLDKSGQYVLVAHHGTDNFVTRISQDDMHGYKTHILFDDASLVLFRVEEDGRLGEACDISVPSRNNNRSNSSSTASHLHCVMADPTGELYLVCDKGTDKIYSYHIDRKKGRLIYLSELSVPEGYAPRYGIYHPFLPVFYITNERRPDLLCLHYEAATGMLSQMYCAPLLAGVKLSKDAATPAASDILIHPDGRYLYVAIRGINQIVVFKLGDYGFPEVIQHIDCRGKNPYGLCISPDRQFLFVANKDSNSICAFFIHTDGLLKYAGKSAEIAEPKNMKIYIVP